LLPFALVAAMGCSSLPTEFGDVVGIQVNLPATLTLAVGDSIQFTAYGLNLAGDSVFAPITFTTPDTTILVDPVSGWVVGVASGNGRVQAKSGNLISSFIPVTVTEP
jgi:hypothetical protein